MENEIKDVEVKEEVVTEVADQTPVVEAEPVITDVVAEPVVEAEPVAEPVVEVAPEEVVAETPAE